MSLAIVALSKGRCISALSLQRGETMDSWVNHAHSVVLSWMFATLVEVHVAEVVTQVSCAAGLFSHKDPPFPGACEWLRPIFHFT